MQQVRRKHRRFDKFRSSNMDKFTERMESSASDAAKAAQAEGQWRKDDLKAKAKAEKDKEMGAKDLAGLKKQMINRSPGQGFGYSVCLSQAQR